MIYIYNFSQLSLLICLFLIANSVSEGEEDLGLQAEQEAKICSFEEAFAKIKDATGVSDIQVYSQLPNKDMFYMRTLCPLMHLLV